MVKFLKAHHQAIITILSIAGIIGYQLYVFLTMKPAPVELLGLDLSGYFSALIQKTNPSLLTRDMIYGNGQFTDSIWYGSAYLYMAAMSAFYSLTGGDIWTTYSLMVLFTLLVYLVIAYIFFAAVLPDWRLALALAIVSSVVSSYAATISYWGIPPNTPAIRVQLIPQVWYHVFVVFMAWLVVRVASIGEDGSIRISPRWAAGLGALVGASIYLIHSISAIGLIEISILSGLVLVLRRRLPLRTVIIYGAALLPFLLIRLFYGSGSATAGASLAASQQVIATGRSGNVFPWVNRFRVPTAFRFVFSYENLVSLIVLGLALYAVLTIVSGILAMRDRPRHKLWKTVFLVTQAGLCLVFFRAGWVPVLVLIYGLLRVWRGEEDEPDRILLTVMMLAFWAGPIQQVALYYVWALAGVLQLTTILFEMARFEGLAYLPLYVLAGRAIWELSGAVRVRWLRLAAAGALCLLVRLNLASTPIPLGVRSPWHVLLGLLALLLVLTRADGSRLAALWSAPARQKTLAALALIAALAGSAIVLFGPDGDLAAPVISAGLVLAIAGWAGLVLVWLPAADRRSVLAPALSIALVLGLYAFATTGQPFPPPAGPLTLPFEKALVLPPPYAPEGASIVDEQDADYLAAGEWARANTPVDSLFHIVDFNTSFRNVAQRSLLLAYTDTFTLAIYSGSDSAVLFRLQQDLMNLQKKHGEQFTALLAHNHVDYVMAWQKGAYKAALADVSECGRRVTPTIAYQNDTYVIYHLQSAPDESADASASGLLCPLSPAERPQVAPAPCGAAQVPAGGPYAFFLRDYPACTLPAPNLTVRCLSGDRWTAGAVSGLDNTSAPGEVSFSAQPPGICGLFPSQ